MCFNSVFCVVIFDGHFSLSDHNSEKAMAPHSSTFAWKITQMEEPGGLQSMGSLRVGHDRVPSLSLSLFPSLQIYSFPGNSQTCLE